MADARTEKSKQKQERKKHREIERKKQQTRMKWLIFTTCAVVVVLIAFAVMYSPKAEPVEFDYQALPVLGSADAPVKIVEIGDYKCPACRLFSQQIKPQLTKDYIDNGKASLYFMNDTFIGPDSFAAAMAGQSVFHQNKAEFWKFNDSVYKNQGDERTLWATPDFLVDLAKKEQLKVDYDQLRQDIENETYSEEVIAHNKKAEKLVRATPTLFINGVKFEDFSNYGALKKAIENALEKAGAAE